jgi:hypothetical protein
MVLISIVRSGYKLTYNQGAPHCKYSDQVMDMDV